MIVDSTSYLLSLLQVFSASALLLLAFPLFMWRHYLKGRSYGYRFVFVLITQNVFLINLVLLLGFFGICNRYTVLGGMAVLYLIVTWHYSKGRTQKRMQTIARDVKALLSGTKKLSSIRFQMRQALSRRIKNIRHWPLWQAIRREWPIYLTLLAAVGYNIWFLTHNVQIYHSVQFSDIPVHQSWVYALSHGTLFVDGIYPFGMHAIVYLLHTLFFLDLREVLLYFGAFQTVMLLVSIYMLARRVLRWKYSALIPVIAFSLLLNQGRYAASLPQEAGMFAVALSAYFLLGFLQQKLPGHIVPRDGRVKRFFRMNQYMTKQYMNRDMLLFMLSVSLCIAYHFYAAIAACLLVLAIVLAYLYRMVRKQYFVPVFMAGLLGILIAVTPYAASLATGVPFQESIDWAVSVLKGEEWQGSEASYQSQLEGSVSGEDASEQADAAEAGLDTQTDETALQQSPLELLQTVYQAMKNFSNSTMYAGVLTDLLMLCIALGFVLGGIWILIVRRLRPNGFGYISMALYMVIMCIVGGAQELNIPEVLAAARASTFAQPFIGILYAVPVDFVFGLISLKLSRKFYGALAAATMLLCGGMVGVIYRYDMVHSFFDVNLAYYNEPVYLIKHIKEEFANHTYTIVATSDEYYQVLDYGYHENLSKFVNMVDGNEEEYKIPTQYVFFFIEKTVLQDYYYGQVDVSPEYANMDFVYIASSQDYYYQRAIIESKAYYWAQRMLTLYPSDFTIYYEDDIYIAYLLKQNPYYLYNLQIDYLPKEE